MRFDDHEASCVIWKCEVDYPECNCKKGIKFRRMVSDWIPTLEADLELGFSTTEIEADLGINYHSIRDQLRRHGKEALRDRLKALRNEEAERNRFVDPNWERPRCIHGVWAKDGKCNHGKLGRYAKVSA